MPPLISEDDLNSTTSAAKPVSSPLPHEDAQKLPLENRIDQAIEEMRRAEVELKAEIFHLRTDIERSSARLRKTTIVTGISVIAIVIVLGVAGANSALLANMNGASESGKPDRNSPAEVAKKIEKLEPMVVKAEETAKLAVRPDCANLPADIKVNAVDYSIQFQVGSANISPTSEATLDSIAKDLSLAPDRCVLIEGHTDATGKAEKNIELSKDRANSVVDYIVEKAGIDRARLVPLGKGSSNPITGVDPRASRNRRVVFKVVTG